MRKGEMMRYLMGIKNCHSCTKRSECKLKNDHQNLSEKGLAFTKLMMSKEWSPRIGLVAKPIETTVTSFCTDFNLEPHESHRR